MDDHGRFEALGRAIYRTFETEPAVAGKDLETKLMEVMKGIKALEEKLLPIRVQEANGCSPELQAARDLIVENIKNEIAALNLVLEWFGERDKQKEIFRLAQWEAEQAQKKGKK